jgi:hypothetical protein
MKKCFYRLSLILGMLLGTHANVWAQTIAFSCEVIGGQKKHQMTFTLNFNTSTIVTSYGYTAKASISDNWIIWDDSFDGKLSQIRLSRHTGLWTRLNHSPNQGFSLPYKCKTVSKRQF